MYWALWLHSFDLVHELEYNRLIISGSIVFLFLMIASAIFGFIAYMREDRLR